MKQFNNILIQLIGMALTVVSWVGNIALVLLMIKLFEFFG